MPSNTRLKLGIVVGDDGPQFLYPVLDLLRKYFEVSVFTERRLDFPYLGRRINPILLKRDLARFLRSIDVAYFEWGTRLLSEATQLPKSCPIIVKLHGYDIFRWHVAIDWANVDLAIVNLQSIARQFLNIVPAMAGRVVAIPVGIDLKRFYPDPLAYGRTIGLLGALNPRKRVYEVILAVAELMRRGMYFHLRIGGDFATGQESYYLMLHSLPQRLGIADQVSFDGQVNDPSAWFGSIDVFISNSFYETQHLALQEAMACERYCIGHCWEGIEEILPQDLIYQTPAELIEQLEGYAALEEEVIRDRTRALRKIVEEQFSIACTASKLVKVIENLA